jgi:hypothetical protein
MPPSRGDRSHRWSRHRSPLQLGRDSGPRPVWRFLQVEMPLFVFGVVGLLGLLAFVTDPPSLTERLLVLLVAVSTLSLLCFGLERTSALAPSWVPVVSKAGLLLANSAITLVIALPLHYLTLTAMAWSEGQSVWVDIAVLVGSGILLIPVLSRGWMLFYDAVSVLFRLFYYREPEESRVEVLHSDLFASHHRRRY